MKKIFYLLSSLMLVFTACDPMEDVYEELDKAKAPYTKKGLSYKMTDTDYKTTTKYFATEEAAAAAIPTLLNTKFPALENGSSAIVTYNLLTDGYDFLGNTVSSYTTYELTTSEDYKLGGTNYSNFDRWSQVETFLNAKYPVSAIPEGQTAEGRLVTLTYTWYNSNTSPTSSTVTDSYYYVGGEWHDTYYVSDANYASVDRNRSYAFTPGDVELLPAYFNNFLKGEFFAAQPREVVYVKYAIRQSSSSTTQHVMAMMFDGTNWNKVAKSDVVITVSTLQFAKINGSWVPDLTKSYKLVSPDDYVWISQQPSLGTTAQLANLGDYKNFYQSWSGSANYWSNDNIKVALAALLKQKFSNEVPGQKFEVTYDYYLSGNKVGTMLFQLNDSGEYVYIGE